MVQVEHVTVELKLRAKDGAVPLAPFQLASSVKDIDTYGKFSGGSLCALALAAGNC